MKCPHCHQEFTPPAPEKERPALRYMIGKGWLFNGLIDDERWRQDPELVEWLKNGWVEFSADHGFRITPLGTSVASA